MIEAGPLVQLHISLSRMFWRIAPAWSVLAGALAVASAVSEPALALRVVAAVVLGDMAWGLLRRSGASGVSASRTGQTQRVTLPYSQDDAPLSQGLQALTLNGMTWQGVLAGLIFTLGGGLLIGLPAVALSAVALLVTVLAWPLTRRGVTSATSMALLDVLLPWMLGMYAGGWANDVSSRWQPLLVALGFTVLHWGMLRAATCRAARRSIVIGIGILAVLGALIVLRMPWAVAMVAVLLAPLVYWWNDVDREGNSISACSTRASPWALVALFVAALALR